MFVDKEKSPSDHKHSFCKDLIANKESDLSENVLFPLKLGLNPESTDSEKISKILLTNMYTRNGKDLKEINIFLEDSNIFNQGEEIEKEKNPNGKKFPTPKIFADGDCSPISKRNSSKEDEKEIVDSLEIPTRKHLYI